MRFASLLLALSLAVPAFAQLAPSDRAPITVPATPKKAESDETNLQTHGHYRNKAG